MARALEVFSQFIARHGLSRSSAVAVAVSGGSDSMALTVLARQFFQRVVGITVDHSLREESTVEAQKTGELVRGLGVDDHHILTIDWEDNLPPTPGKVQMRTREKRYPMMLELCAEKDIPILLVGHHRDDQIETFISRLSKGSGVDGLGGMYPITKWPEHTSVAIVRPLLECDKTSLVEVCRGEGVEWVEDASNKSDLYTRNVIRSVLAQHPELVSGIGELVDTCGEARAFIKQQVNSDVINDLMTVDQELGLVMINAVKFRKLLPPVAERVARLLLLFINGGNIKKPIRFQQFAEICDTFRNPGAHGNVSTNGDILIVPLNNSYSMIVKQVSRYQRTLTPIKIGQTIHWDNRFMISLKPLRIGLNNYQATRHTREFFVRHMLKRDWALARKGLRKIRATKLPHEAVRGSLPVIVDGNRNVVLIPHFRIIDRTAGVLSTVTFEPKATLKGLIDPGTPD